MYFNAEMSANEIVNNFDLASTSNFHTWVRTYIINGNLKDNRGKATKADNPNKGRPRKDIDKPLEELSKEELIERVMMLEDIKKIPGLPNKPTAKQKYQVIDMLRDKYSVNALCKVLECSKSEYYDWIKLGRTQNKAFDESTNEIVVKMHKKNKT